MKLSRQIIAFGLILLIVAARYATADSQAPQSPLPLPTGSFAVGRTLFDWTDPVRPDTINKTPGRNREIMVWLWYPASPKSGAQSAEWLPGKWGDVFYSEFQKSPTAVKGNSSDFIHTVRTHSYTDATVSDASLNYPVLIFSPGYGALPTQYASIIEDIVSHGYIVAGIVPTYFTYITVFPDGRVAGNQTSNMDQRSSLPIWVDDMTFTLSQLEKLNADKKSPFRNRFDFSRLGVFGHSRGGGAALQFAKQDARVKAAISLDGTPGGTVAVEGLSKPVAVILAGRFSEKKKENSNNDSVSRYETIFHNGKPGFRISIIGSTHLSFSDIGLLPFVADADKKQLGPIEPTRALAISSAYIRAFFDLYLNGKQSSLLAGLSRDYPDIEFERTAP